MSPLVIPPLAPEGDRENDEIRGRCLEKSKRAEHVEEIFCRP